MAVIDFDINDFEEEQKQFSLIPPGQYLAQIIESEMKPTRRGADTGNGDSYLEFKFKITDGEFSGRYLWERLNVKNINPKAQNIGRAKLNNIAKLLGLSSFEDSVLLHDLSIGIMVIVEKATGYQDRNIIKGYIPFDKIETQGVFNLNKAERLGAVCDATSQDEIPF